MLRFRVTNKGCVFLTIILRPAGKFFPAVSITHAADKFRRFAFRSSVTQRIQGNGVGNIGERIAIFRTAEHRSLAIQMNEVAEKDDKQKHSGSYRNADLVARKLHDAHTSLA